MIKIRQQKEIGINMLKPRQTFNLQIEYDSNLGLGPWKWIAVHNGFSVNFGILGVAIRIQYVRTNYR